MISRAQSAVEWMMTHSWAVIVILVVGLTLAHLGFFDAQARPRFEGLNAAGIQPMPSEVQLYSDGVLVLTVRNTRPYTMRYDWVDIAPIGDPSDKIRTYLGSLLKQGDVGTYTVNGSNLQGESDASLLMFEDSMGKTTYTDFTYSHQETHLMPGRNPETKTYTNAKAHQITTYNTPHGDGGEVTTSTTGGPFGMECYFHRRCTCTETGECPLPCQVCYDGYCDNYIGCPGEGGINAYCNPIVGSPSYGACSEFPTCEHMTSECPLGCLYCDDINPSWNMCYSTCEVGYACRYSPTALMGLCVPA